MRNSGFKSVPLCLGQCIWLFPEADVGDVDVGDDGDADGAGDVGDAGDAGDAGHPLATQPSSRLRMTEHV